MNIFETITLSLTAIMRNRLRSFLTTLGVVIGVFSVILLVALVSGLQSFITDQISSFGSNLVFVIPGQVTGAGRGPGGSTVNRLQFQDVNNLKRELKGKADVSTVTQKAASAKYNSKISKNMTISGVEDIYPKIVTAVQTAQGRFINKAESNSGKRVAVLGPTAVKNLFGDSNPLNKTITINNTKYQVIGVIKPRGAAFGVDQDNSAFVPLEAQRKQFGIDQPNAIYISVYKTEDINSVQAETKTLLEKRVSADDFTVQTQEQALSTISQITGVLTLALGGIAAISLIVGGIGVMNIMLVSVTERTREIGLRKALGARSKDIRNQFLIEALTLSGVGGIIGIIFGVGIALLVDQFVFTTTITWWSIALSFGFSMLVGVIFGVTPAIRASRLDPIQALRYE
ncbi:MAG TPA: ABC transporter permease [Patescibacteria group bacterium]|nr:ABC transporter permease [Patescibacteria group bacterium]